MDERERDNEESRDLEINDFTACLVRVKRGCFRILPMPTWSPVTSKTRC